MQVNILEARNNLSRLIKAATEGERVVIATRGKPVVQLVPVSQSSARQGSGGTILDWLKQNPLPAYARRPAREIDADIREAREAWD